MFTDNLKIPWQNIIKHNSFVNTLGLVVSISAYIIKSVWIWDENNCDKSHENSESIF